MPTMPKSFKLGALPAPPADANKPSRVRDFLLQHKIKPHPTKRSMGILPDGTAIPLSSSQLRALALLENEQLPLLPQPQATGSCCSCCRRFEAKLDRLLALLS